MIWVAWRQQRVQILASLGLIVACAIIAVWVRIAVTRDLSAAGLSNCWPTTDECTAGGIDAIIDKYATYRTLYPFVGLALPVLLGMFVGAPMFAREIEAGSHVFALTQSISRRRWWTTKAIVGGLPVVAAMTGLGVLNTWATRPLPGLNRQLTTPRFETEGLVVGGYTLLAVALGIALGLWLKSTVVAMAVSLAVYIGLLIMFASVARRHYEQPVYEVYPLGDSADFGNGWLVGSGYLDADDNQVATPNECKGTGVRQINSQEDALACLKEMGLERRFVRYQPADRFWTFQLAESGGTALVSASLLGLSAVAVRRRLS